MDTLKASWNTVCFLWHNKNQYSFFSLFS